MKLGIVGTGAMGQVLLTCAKSDPDIGQIFMIEPTQKESWPDQKLDLLIDFSHPHAICGIYEYCRARRQYPCGACNHRLQQGRGRNHSHAAKNLPG